MSDRDQICCLIENGGRCRKQSGNASFNFRVQKLVEQRKLKFSLDSSVCFQIITPMFTLFY